MTCRGPYILTTSLWLERGSTASVTETRVAIIGGTGVYEPAFSSEPRREKVITPYGDTVVWAGRGPGKIPVFFLPRHGPEHRLPPHRINYRANIWALKWLQVKRVIATGAVGSLQPHLPPGSFVVVDQFIDFTRNRPSTFYDRPGDPVVHTDFTEPYCPDIRKALLRAAADRGVAAHDGATYLCTEGPRYETPAEIRIFQGWGADLVGMTGIPEVVLAREAGICFGLVAVVTNFAAGLGCEPLSHAEVSALMAEKTPALRELILLAVSYLGEMGERRSCRCQAAG